MARLPLPFVRAVAWAGFGLFLVQGLPALWVWVAEADDPGYGPALRAHVVLGVAAAVTGLVALLAHLYATGSRPERAFLATLAPLGASWLLLDRFAFAHLLPDGHLLRFASAGRAAGLAAVAVALVAAVARALPPLARPTPTRLAGLAVAWLCFAAAATGWEGQHGRGDARWGALAAHSFLGVLAFAVLLLHLRAVRERLGVAGGGLLLLGCAAAAAVNFDRQYLAGFTEVGAAERWTTASTEGSSPPPWSPLPEAATCGEAGCHEALTEQWRGSPHRFAARNRLVQAAMAEAEAEAGAAAIRVCARCHDPERVLTGIEGRGVTCLACHLAYDAPAPEGNGIASYRQPREPADTIALDPRLHRQTMTADRLGMSDEGCGVCHRLDLGLVHRELGTSGLAEVIEDPFLPEAAGGPRTDVSCSLCHMPVRTPQPGGRLPLYDHRWPGVNVDLAGYALAGPGDAAAIEAGRTAVRGFIAGRDAPQALPDDPGENAEFDAYRDSLGLGLLAVVAEARRRGGTIELSVETTNHRSGHPFPSGPLDLQEVWMEVRVLDRTGRELARLGALRDGRVPDGAPRLGAVELGPDGGPLRRHRLFELTAITDKRRIDPGDSVTDRLLIPADPGADAVEVRWWLRRIAPDFANWALQDPEGWRRFAPIEAGQTRVGIEGD